MGKWVVNVHALAKTLKRQVKKRRPEGRLFYIQILKNSGAGWRVVVIASSNYDAANNSSRSYDSYDYAATATKLAFFLGCGASALYLGSCNRLNGRRK
jgi:hypothetical protein